MWLLQRMPLSAEQTQQSLLSEVTSPWVKVQCRSVNLCIAAREAGKYISDSFSFYSGRLPLYPIRDHKKGNVPNIESLDNWDSKGERGGKEEGISPSVCTLLWKKVRNSLLSPIRQTHFPSWAFACTIFRTIGLQNRKVPIGHLVQLSCFIMEKSKHKLSLGKPKLPRITQWEFLMWLGHPSWGPYPP